MKLLSQPHPLFADVLRSVKGRLSNVQQLRLHWERHHRSGMNLRQHPIWSLVAEVWPTIGPRLRSLSLDMPLTALTAFIATLAPITWPTNIRQLDITFNADQISVWHTAASEDDIHTLLTFVHGHSSILESLSITTYDHVNLSPFFSKLGYLPCLTTLSLIIPFDVHHVLDPSAFNQVLINHPDIHSLTIQNRFTNCCGTWQTPTNVVSDEWVRQCFEGVNPAQLKEFKLGVSCASGITRCMLLAMKPLCFALSSLTIIEPCLTWESLSNMLRSLQLGSLKVLSLFIYVLDSDFVDLLVESCPNLQHLTLDIERVGLLNENLNYDFNRFLDEEVSQIPILSMITLYPENPFQGRIHRINSKQKPSVT